MPEILELQGTRTIPWNDSFPSGVVADRVYFGRDETGVGEVQIAVGSVNSRPTKSALEAMWRTRSANTAMPVVVAAVGSDGVWLFSPGSDSKVLGPIPQSQAQAQLQAILDEPHGLAAHQRIRAVQRMYDSIGLGGFDNHFLFATYHLREDAPKRPDWAEAGSRGESMRSKRGRELIDALGFTAEEAPGNALVLRSGSGSRRAIAILLDESDHFAQKSPAYQLSPVARGLELAGREDVPWVILLRQSTLRLYPGRDGVGVGQRGQSETYFELDLLFLDPEFAALLPLIFSADALERDGSADDLLSGSSRYAAVLGTRLRDRVYEGVVPGLAKAISTRLPDLGLAVDADGLKMAYKLTMRILFRLLFQAYGEATELLPAGRNTHFDANSLQAFVDREITTPPDAFAETASSIWLDLVQVWDAIFQGNSRWEVPAYGGSLFDPETEEGALLQRLQLPDSVIGPALQAMLTEVTEDGVPGPVDFRSLQVREFGTIYEGLLESSLSLADSDLTLDSRGAYVPAKDGDEVVARAGQAYFHSASGERKATGSYYTPKVVVDHLIERSVQPALEKHLVRVRELLESGKERQAADLFFDFRVADLAMGSAHFLVAAVDKIERGMRDFLTAHPVPGAHAELQRLSEKAREALGADVQAAEAITDAQLLRRQVARRCIYGLDINPLAVELSQLAVWIHTFVPGLPMSSLDHGLVLGNSLTGVGTIDEALDSLEPKRLPGQATFFDDVILDELALAKVRLADFAAASEADKSEVAAGAKLLAEAKAASETVRRIFDAAVAIRIGEVPARALLTAEDLEELLANPAVVEVATRLSPAHMPYLFPEVFLRDNPGFDVLVGNPPWEKVKIEEHQWWGLRIPKLRSMAQREKNAALTTFKAERPDLVVQFEEEVAATDALRAVLVKGPYPGIGSGGDPDLYQAFAWRFWRLVRESGRTAIVLPRGALSGSALAQWRKEILSDGSFADVCFLLNNQNWVFPSVHPQYTVGLTVVERGGDHVARFCGPFASQKEFLEGAGELAEVDADEFAAWSTTAAFPLIPDPKSAEVFRQMKQSPRFDDVRPDWEFRPLREFDATLDKDKFEFDIDEARGRLPVLAGASFNLWNPDFGTPYAYAPPEALRRALAGKLANGTQNKRSAYFGLSFPSGELPMDRARIAFRDVTNQTNTRTGVFALLPPGIVCTHKAPLLVRRAGGAIQEAALLGILASLPFDWYLRRWIELTLSFELLNPSPIPRPDSTSTAGARLIEIAGRLAAVDERYADWAAEVGVEVGTAKDDVVKNDLIAELDALVSLLYGLTEDQVEHVFATFHRGWDYRPRLDAVLAHYATWKDR